MLELIKRKIIATGRNKTTFYYQLPAKWCWSRELNKGDDIHIIITDKAIIAFPDEYEAKRFYRNYEKTEKK